jgi:hypothetical protein
MLRFVTPAAFHCEITVAEVLESVMGCFAMKEKRNWKEYWTFTCTTQPGAFFTPCVEHAAPVGVVPGHVVATVR